MKSSIYLVVPMGYKLSPFVAIVYKGWLNLSKLLELMNSGVIIDLSHTKIDISKIGVKIVQNAEHGLLLNVIQFLRIKAKKWR